VSAHLRSPLLKNALTWAFVVLLSALGLILAPAAAEAASRPSPAPSASHSAAEQSLASATAPAPLANTAKQPLGRAASAGPLAGPLDGPLAGPLAGRIKQSLAGPLAGRIKQSLAGPLAGRMKQSPGRAATAAPLSATAKQSLGRAGARVQIGAGWTTVTAAPLSPAARLAVRGARIVAVAGAQRGKPYRRGAQGPGAFDCSGLSGYAYRAVHIRLPRTANAQYHAARPIVRGAARPGDLVFWVSGGHAYHVAVYAGAGRVWHAPKPGDRVRLAKIWDSGQVRFGRIGA
jgi:cell wall-associated NlpC family hydrolase